MERAFGAEQDPNEATLPQDPTRWEPDTEARTITLPLGV